MSLPQFRDRSKAVTTLFTVCRERSIKFAMARAAAITDAWERAENTVQIVVGQGLEDRVEKMSVKDTAKQKFIIGIICQ